MKYLHINPAIFLHFLIHASFFLPRHVKKVRRILLAKKSNILLIMHTINCNQITGVYPMSDLAATNCQNSCSSGCGCGNDCGFNNCFWLLLILLCCNNGSDCGCGNDNLIWLILILCCCGNGCGIGTSGNGCNCGCGC